MFEFDFHWNANGEKVLTHLTDSVDNVDIEAGHIQLGKEVILGSDVHIKVKGAFKLGDYGNLGHDVSIRAQEVDIGPHFFHMEPGLKIGGGGSTFPDAILKVGARCVFHNNYINLAKPITIGDDVGLSPGSELLTHGFWWSVLEGFPQLYSGIKLGNNVHIGQRSMILQGVEIASNTVVGANSTVTKSLLEEYAIYAGTPAKFIKKIIAPSYGDRLELLDNVIAEYKRIGGPTGFQWAVDYPYIYINDVTMNVETMTLVGEEDIETDRLRDFLRRYGIRIYTGRPFVGVV